MTRSPEQQRENEWPPAIPLVIEVKLRTDFKAVIRVPLDLTQEEAKILMAKIWKQII